MGKSKKVIRVENTRSDKVFFQKNLYAVSFLAIIIIILISYSNSFNNSFQYDDVHHIFESKHNKDFESFKNPSFWFHFTQRAPAQFTFAVNYYLNEYSVTGYHVFNLIIHLLSSVIVFLLAGILLSSSAIKEKYILPYKKHIQLFTALIFAAHPIQTESVTYIVQRMESLSFLFYAGALIMYYLFRKEKNTGSQIFKFALFALSGLLSVMTKQTAYTLPLAILILEIYFIRDKNGKSNRKLIYSLTSILTLSLIIGLITDTLPREVLSETGRIEYMLSQFTVILKYVFLMFVPVGQNIDHHIVIPGSIFEFKVIAGIFIIFLMILSGYFLYRKGHVLLSFSIAWFFAVISLRSSVLPISDLMSEHRLYPAIFGYGLFVSAGIFYLLDKFSSGKNIVRNASVILVLAVFSYSAAAYLRNRVWKNELTLWQDSVSKSPEKFRPNYNYAEALKKNGNSTAALEFYLKAYSLNDKSYGVCNNIGNIYAADKKYDEAEYYYKKALELFPSYPKALSNLANVYYKKAIYDKAEELYIKASEADPLFIDPVLNLGHLYFITEHYDLSVEKYKRVLELDPDNSQATNNLKIILSGQQ
ncbi:MAG TPA: tetratricopeptide repeat protein [Clostridiales bacterium]|nr:tetratricopeptide repeat protein [Clostridiales bacterium]HQP70696.1 tetratricopeptide repeat protein [Clostridiales bacterium]